MGSIAWYTHLYGTLPFLREVHAGHLSDEGLHPPAYPWSHKGPFDSFDHARSARENIVLTKFPDAPPAFDEVTKYTAKSVRLATL